MKTKVLKAKINQNKPLDLKTRSGRLAQKLALIIACHITSLYTLAPKSIVSPLAALLAQPRKALWQSFPIHAPSFKESQNYLGFLEI